jgi:hypothetical protein
VDISQLIDVSIKIQDIPNTVVPFGVGLLMTRNSPDVDTIAVGTYKIYTNTEDVATDWGASENVMYAAEAWFDQTPSPASLLIGRAAAPIASVDVVTVVTGTDAHEYDVFFGAVKVSFTSVDNTIADICTGIAAAINAASVAVTIPPVTAVAGGTTVTITSQDAGLSYDVTINDAKMTLARTTQNHSLVDDVMTIRQTVGGDQWYCLLIDNYNGNAFEVTQLAAFIEGLKKIFVVLIDADPTSAFSDTSLPGELFASKFTRTMFLITQTTNPTTDASQYTDVAIAAANLTYTPGSKNWAYTSLAGIISDNFTDSQIANIKAVKGNYYVPITSDTDVFQNGAVPSGDWIDVITGSDWISLNMQNDLLALFLSQPKIPYTDTGIGMIYNIVNKRLQMAVDNGILASPDGGKTPAYTIQVTSADDITPTQKATRAFNAMTFTGLLAGAVNTVQITGTVTY